MLDKKTCKLIGTLYRMAEVNYGLLQLSGWNIEYMNKVRLLERIAKQLEEQKRGFLKSKLPYAKAGEFLFAQTSELCYDELLAGVTDILLGPDLKRILTLLPRKHESHRLRTNQ